MNEPYRLRYTNQIVGAFLLAVLVLIVVLLAVLLRAGDAFVQHESYWVEVDQEEVAELQRGAEVMILGQRAGTVQDLQYIDQTDRVRIDFNIDPRLGDQIFANSYVRLERKFGVGTPVLVIRRGAPGQEAQPPLEPGTRLGNFQGEADRFDQMSQQLATVSESVRLIQQQLDPTLTDISSAANRFQGSLDNSVDPALAETERASSSLYQTSEAIRPETLETLQAVRAATENLEARVESLTEKIASLVDNDVRDTLVEVRQSSDDISAAARSVDQTSQEVNQDIANTLETLREAANQVEQLAIETRDVVRIVRREADDLPGTTARFNDTVSDTQDLVGEIRGHWLLRRSSRQGKPSDQIAPSTIRGGGSR